MGAGAQVFYVGSSEPPSSLCYKVCFQLGSVQPSSAAIGSHLTGKNHRWVSELRQEVTPSEVSGSHLSSEGSDSHDVIVKSNCKDHNSTN